jgi:SAM-dependent methyltransferase
MSRREYKGVPDWAIALLCCPVCTASALCRTDIGLICEACGHRPLIKDGVLDMTASALVVSAADRAYEGLLGHGYARFMDSLWLQRLDSWLLGMDVKRYHEEILARLARLPPGPSLEIPVGGGPFLEYAPTYQSGGPWIFADLSWTMLRRLRRKCEAMGLHGVVLIRANACRLPLCDGKLRNIVSLFGLHCFHDKAAVFSEMRRCLASDGRVVASTLTSDGPPLSRFYLRLHQYDGTFAADNSLHELNSHAQQQLLWLDISQRLGAAVLFEAHHA